MSKNGEIISNMFWNFIKNSKKRNLKNLVFRKLSNYATNCLALFSCSLDIYINCFYEPNLNKNA